MNKLEERFEELIIQSNKDMYIELPTVYNCAKEAKDVAIEYARYILLDRGLNGHRDGEVLFDEFIEEKYGE